MVVWRRKNISQNRTDDTQISPVNVEEKTIDTGNDTLKSNTEEEQSQVVDIENQDKI